MLTIASTIRLNNDVEIPRLGLGVYQSEPGRETEEAVMAALELGYRHIDTARVYSNEADVGRAIAASGVPRDDLFVTTKVWNRDQGFDSTLRALEKSLAQLKLERVDLYLIHWPMPERHADTWRAMRALLDRGLARAVGVSNYTVRHLKRMCDEPGALIPAVNQVEFSPFLNQRDLLAVCRGYGIALEAYSPLTQGKKLRDPRLVPIAKKYRKTAAQILIRWSLQHDLIVIPKSVKRERIRENSDVYDFEMDAVDMASLDQLDEGFRTCWDPTSVP